ncbi:MAG: NAD(P)/FAD-dependent oxidoreductase [bacterium]
MRDLIVVGGGPAGLTTALYAARAGLDTVVFDPRPAPIDKACGEGIMPGAVRALRDLDVALDGHEIRGISYHAGKRFATADFRSGSGCGVLRTHLQAELLRRVRQEGITVHERRVDSVDQDVYSVRAGGEIGRYLAAADGLHSPIRRQLGLGSVRRDRSPRWGLRRHFSVPPWSDRVEVHWGPDAEVYVTPVSADTVGVAVLSSRRGSFTEHLARFPAVLERLPELGVDPVRGAGPLRQRTRQRVAGRVLLVGDSSGYVDALTGEGIAVATACGRALVDCVAVDQPGRYEDAWLKATRRYRWITESLLWSRRRPWLRPLIVPAASALPQVFGAAVGQLAR